MEKRESMANKREKTGKRSALASGSGDKSLGLNKKKTSLSLKGFYGLDRSLLLQMLTSMIKSRVLEERLIKIYKGGEAYFWIGAPGEEAWGVPLGMLVHKGEGPQYDWLHLHYRATPTLVAMGMPMIDSIRLIMNRSTDVSTGGRNFCNHYAYKEWNVAPVSSPIEVQYLIAIGTAHAQKRHYLKKGSPSNVRPVTIVTGGDAGTAEGDFASCLVWASRKGQELPMLITVQNNGWGISTPYLNQHGETHIADRAKGFNIRSRVINGNDPVESYLAVQEELSYIRKTGKPAFIEAMVSRLYGHSSASGANFVGNEEDCLKVFEKKLIDAKLISSVEVKALYEAFETEGRKAQDQVRLEPFPTADTVWNHVFVASENADWREF